MVVSINNNAKYPLGLPPQTGVTHPNFRGVDTVNPNNTLEKSPEVDVVEISPKKEKKKGLSTGAKWGIGIAGTLGTLITAGLLIYKHEYNKLTKLFNKNLTISNLPENILFKEAKTLDEAIKFAKETLGVEHIDKDFTLEMLNYANKGIVDVSNANKGKLFVPKKLIIDKDTDAVAYAVSDIRCKDFGSLGINPKFFTHDGLNKIIDELFVNKNTNCVHSSKKKAKEETQIKLLGGLSKGTWGLIDKFKKNPNSISLQEKIQIYANYKSSMRQSIANRDLKVSHPLEWVKNNLKLFENNNIEVDLNKLKTLSKESQSEEVKKLLKIYSEKTKQDIITYGGSDNPYFTLYHEMGHLQDYAKNLEMIEKEEIGALNFFKSMKKIFSNKQSIGSYADHWGGSTYEKEKELMKKSPNEFKILYPNLYKHLNDPEYQRIASYSGSYAMTGIGEFIAETYAYILSGRKLPQEVIELYKKYGGPLFPGM